MVQLLEICRCRSPTSPLNFPSIRQQPDPRQNQAWRHFHRDRWASAKRATKWRPFWRHESIQWTVSWPEYSGNDKANIPRCLRFEFSTAASSMTTVRQRCATMMFAPKWIASSDCVVYYMIDPARLISKSNLVSGSMPTNFFLSDEAAAGADRAHLFDPRSRLRN